MKRQPPVPMDYVAPEPVLAQNGPALRPRNAKVDALVKRIHASESFSFEAVRKAIAVAMKKAKAKA
jgi:hypothetical protein